MKDLKNIELLAPAGDMEGIRTALKYGADAIYCGGPFMQMRASKVGFDLETLAEASKLIHEKGKKLFVTVNCFANNDEIPRLGEYAKQLKALGADAIIVSDLGAICEIREKCPEMDIHVSTQANCMNYRTAQLYHSLGVKRIVLAREMSIKQIKELRENIPEDLEIEAFIHGAMCMSYSGRCLISAYLTGRSGNRGECAQSCRWNYYLMEEKRPGEYFKIEESDRGSAILSSKEMCCAAFLDQLADAGICSFKVEGRMRTPFYTATVINAYRLLLDGKITVEEAMDELNTVSHRPFCSGFYLGDPNAIIPDTEGYIRDWLFVATAEEESEGGLVEIITRNPFEKGDEIELLSPGSKGKKFTVETIITEEGETIERSATPMKRLKINIPYKTEPGDIIRKKN